MINSNTVRNLVEQQLEQTDLFLVELSVSPSLEVEVVLDSDTRVDIDDCVRISRALEEGLNREEVDFHLTVTSAGIGNPLKMLRQYLKLIGRPIEVILLSGMKLVGTLTAADDRAIVLEYPEKVAVEGKKRKEIRITTREILLAEIKSTVEYLDFK